MLYSKKKVLIVNRWPGQDKSSRTWDGSLLNYLTHVDHKKYDVYYIVDEVSRSGVPKTVLDDPSRIIQVSKTLHDNNSDEIVPEIVQAIRERFDKIEFYRIIALSEMIMGLGARLRSHFDVPGIDELEIAKYRDKYHMKEALKGSGILTPSYQYVKKEEPEFSLPYPFIAKPFDGDSARGVEIIRSPEDAEKYLATAGGDFLIEQLQEASLCFIDGVVQGGELKMFSPSYYLNTPLDYTRRQPLGFYTITNAEEFAILKDQTLKIVKSLGLDDSMFHLEVFFDGKSCTFLEIGARMGGADIIYNFFDSYGINLQDIASQVELGETLPELPNDVPEFSRGFLLIPPDQTPFIVKESHDIYQNWDQLRRYQIPTPGEVIDGQYTYHSHLIGRFHFETGSQNESVQLINKIISAHPSAIVRA